MYNFIVFSLARWNVDYGCNVKDICDELAKEHRVLYIDVPLKRKDRWLKKDRDDVKEVESRIASGKQLIELKPNLWHYIDDSVLESVNSLKNNTLFDWLVKINNKRFAKAIKRAAAAVGFDTYILLNDNNIYDGLHLKNLLRPQHYVYYLRDHLPAMAYWKRHVSRLQPDLIRKADLVVTNSLFLESYAHKWNRQSHYIGQGCDVDHFLTRPENSMMEGLMGQIKRPIIGYIGAVNGERLDILLIHQMAVLLPEFSFVFIGREDTKFSESPLHSLPNVFFLGAKDFSELPQYLYSFDVAINPQRLNEITLGNYPRKIDEYLASGKPVVATKTLAMEVFKDFVYLGENADDYVRLIREAVQQDSEENQIKRKEFARTHTWPNSVNEFLTRLDTLK